MAARANLNFAGVILNWLLTGFGVVIGGSCEQGSDESAEQSLSASPGVVDELEKSEIDRQLLLRDSVLHRDGRGKEGPIAPVDQAMRTEFGRPRSSIWLRTWAAMAASVARASSL
jgi:hypothetical protein